MEDEYADQIKKNIPIFCNDAFVDDDFDTEDDLYTDGVEDDDDDLIDPICHKQEDGVCKVYEDVCECEFRDENDHCTKVK